LASSRRALARFLLALLDRFSTGGPHIHETVILRNRVTAATGIVAIAIAQVIPVGVVKFNSRPVDGHILSVRVRGGMLLPHLHVEPVPAGGRIFHPARNLLGVDAGNLVLIFIHLLAIFGQHIIVIIVQAGRALVDIDRLVMRIRQMQMIFPAVGIITLQEDRRRRQLGQRRFGLRWRHIGLVVGSQGSRILRLLVRAGLRLPTIIPP